ncbi:alpha/beta hydrolase, partial [Enterococcus faecalis]|nr:alpha/beta hydrolase [Enterococcus faecalis]
IKGLILLASYPSEKTDLSQSRLAVLSVTADHDQVINWKAYEQASKRLPKSTQFVTISGGNHSGFGLYGQQDKDGQATISPQEQQDQLISLIDDFLNAN